MFLLVDSTNKTIFGDNTMKTKTIDTTKDFKMHFDFKYNRYLNLALGNKYLDTISKYRGDSVTLYADGLHFDETKEGEPLPAFVKTDPAVNIYTLWLLKGLRLEKSRKKLDEDLTPLEVDLLEAIESILDPAYIKTKDDYLNLLTDFQRFRGGSYLISTKEIIEYTTKFNDDYTDFVNNHMVGCGHITCGGMILKVPTADTILKGGISFYSDFLFFEVTPLIIQDFIRSLYYIKSLH